MADGGTLVESLPRVQLYVAVFGDDEGPGTKQQPLRTLGRAMELARDLEASQIGLKADVYVKSGAYWIHSRLLMK